MSVGVGSVLLLAGVALLGWICVEALLRGTLGVIRPTAASDWELASTALRGLWLGFVVGVSWGFHRIGRPRICVIVALVGGAPAFFAAVEPAAQLRWARVIESASTPPSEPAATSIAAPSVDADKAAQGPELAPSAAAEVPLLPESIDVSDAAEPPIDRTDAVAAPLSCHGDDLECAKRYTLEALTAWRQGHPEDLAAILGDGWRECNDEEQADTIGASTFVGRFGLTGLVEDSWAVMQAHSDPGPGDEVIVDVTAAWTRRESSVNVDEIATFTFSFKKGAEGRILPGCPLMKIKLRTPSPVRS